MAIRPRKISGEHISVSCSRFGSLYKVWGVE
jgi:hypothetical protein